MFSVILRKAKMVESENVYQQSISQSPWILLISQKSFFVNFTTPENSLRVTELDLEIQTSYIKLYSKSSKETWDQNLENIRSQTIVHYLYLSFKNPVFWTNTLSFL